MARSFIQNIVGFSTASDIVKLGKGFTLNMYQETTDSNEHAFSKVLRPMPGYSSVSTGVSGNPRGMYRVSRGYDGKPKVYGIWGQSVMLVKDDGSLSLVGQVHVGTNQCHFCETGGNGSAHPHLVIVDGTSVFAVDTTLEASQQAVDFRQVQIPLRVNSTEELIKPTHCAYAYGYLVVNDANTDAMVFSYQYPFEQTNEAGTDIEYDVFRCNSTSRFYISDNGWVEYSEWQPDNTLALIGNGSRIFTFGERSYQVFSYSASGNTPFTSPDTASQMIGIKAANTLASFGNRCVWLGSAEMGNGQVFSLTSDNELTRISTPEIERTIAKCDFETASAFMFQYGQHPFYVLDFPDDKVTLCYDFREEGWVNMGSLIYDGTVGSFRYRNPAMSSGGETYLQGVGCLVKVDDSKWTEHDGTHIVRKRRGGMVTVGHRPFYVDSLEFLTNNGEYERLQNDCKVILRYSTDGVTWSDEETFSMGAVGEYDFDTTFYNIGYVRNALSVEISCSEDAPFALYGINASVRECH